MGGLIGEANAATNAVGAANAMGTIAGGGYSPSLDTGTILRPSGLDDERPRTIIRPAPAETSSEIMGRAQAALGSKGDSGDQSSALFEQRVKGTALAGKQSFIDDLARKRDVPPEVAKAIIALETGWGKSLKGNNPAGIMKPNSPNQTQKVAFSSIEAGLERSMDVIAKNYHKAGGDLQAMNQTYAPPGAKNDPNNTNRFWARDVGSIATKLGYAPQSYSTAGRF